MLLFNSPEAIIIRDNPISCGILVKYKVSSSPVKLWIYSWPTKLSQISISNVSKTSVCKSVFVFCWWCLLGHTTKMSRREHKRHCTHPSCCPDKPSALCWCPVPSPLLHSWREWNTGVWMFSSSLKLVFGSMMF